MTDISGSSEEANYKYMTNRELMMAVAEAANLENYNPDRAGQNTNYSRFTKEERRRIYETLSGKSGEEYLRNQLPKVILSEIGEDLDSAFDDEFSRDDLKKIHQELLQRKS